MNYSTIGILGLGLMGGALAHHLRLYYPDHTIIGVDPNNDSCKFATHKGWVNKASSELSHCLQCDVLFVAVPVSQYPRVFEEIALHGNPNAIICDIASVKAPVAAIAERLAPTQTWISGHPMAGSEKGGISNSHKVSFERAPFILIKTDTPHYDPFKAFVKRLGFQIQEATSIEDHDRLVAYASHIPYVMALLTKKAPENLPEILKEVFPKITGPGFRDTTRVSASQPAWAREVLIGNRSAVLEGLEYISSQLTAIIDQLSSSSETELGGQLDLFST
jgi:prephenate dehydrogenase